MNYQLIRWLLSQKGIGRAKVRRILTEIGEPENLWHGDLQQLKPYEDLLGKKARALLQTRDKLKYEDDFLNQVKHCDRIITWLDDTYPESLKHITDPPLILYCKGDASLLENGRRRIGVVGTRLPTDYGRSQTQSIVEVLASAGAVIVSGMAMGIDACAHKAALKAYGSTIAILGCGVDQIYPKTNTGLYHQIVQAGLVMSEYSVGTEPFAPHFPERNRIISGLSESVLVIEASKKSGSLITAEMAMDQGNVVYALPGPITSEKSLGCHLLIHSGATPIIGAESLAYELSLDHYNRRKLLQSELALVVKGLIRTSGAVSLDEMNTKLDLSIPELIMTLVDLESNGEIIQMGGRYSLCSEAV